MKTSCSKALDKKKGKDVKGVNNLVKGNEGKVDDKGKKVKGSYKFIRDEGAKNNDSQED